MNEQRWRSVGRQVTERASYSMPETVRTRIERSDLLDTPVFWAIHYYLLVITDEIDSAELMKPFFGLTNEFVNSYYAEHFAKKSWPYFRIQLPQGFAVEVEYAGEPDDEIRYIVDREDWETSVVLGYDSGHFALPALRWSEVVQIGKCVSATAQSPAHRNSGLLLFFPGAYVTQSDQCEEIRTTLCDAWQRLGVLNNDTIGQLVDNIIDYRKVDTEWSIDPKLGWINDSQYSLRNPKTLMCAFDPTRFERIQDFLRMLEAFM